MKNQLLSCYEGIKGISSTTNRRWSGRSIFVQNSSYTAWEQRYGRQKLTLLPRFPSQYACKRVKNYQSGQRDHVSVLLLVLSRLLLGIGGHYFCLAYIWYHNTCLSRNRSSQRVRNRGREQEERFAKSVDYSVVQYGLCRHTNWCCIHAINFCR